MHFLSEAGHFLLSLNHSTILINVVNPGWLSRIRMFFYPGSECFSFSDPMFFFLRSRIRMKEYSRNIFNPKNCLHVLGNMIRVVHPGSGVTHPGSNGKKGTGSRIRNTNSYFFPIVQAARIVRPLWTLGRPAWDCCWRWRPSFGTNRTGLRLTSSTAWPRWIRSTSPSWTTSWLTGGWKSRVGTLKGLSHEIDFDNIAKNWRPGNFIFFRYLLAEPTSCPPFRLLFQESLLAALLY